MICKNMLCIFTACYYFLFSGYTAKHAIGAPDDLPEPKRPRIMDA